MQMTAAAALNLLCLYQTHLISTMKNPSNQKEEKLLCQDPLTGTFRYSNLGSQFSVNKATLIEFLKRQSTELGLTQSRICFHPENESILQVMLVYHSSCHEVKRHVHLDKDEYIQIIEGSLKIRIYSECGEVVNSILLSSEKDLGKHDLFCFLPKGVVHDVTIQVDSIFIETTTGPFHKGSTINIAV